jgi:hypothetical protein
VSVRITVFVWFLCLFPLPVQHHLEAYSQAGLLKSQGDSSVAPLPPHVFAVADQAFRDMVNEDYDAEVAGGCLASSMVAAKV